MDGSARSAVVIGPMGVGQVIDAGLKLGRQNYRQLAIIIAYAVVPAFVIGEIAELVLGGPFLARGLTAIGASVASIAVTIASAELMAPASGSSNLDPGSLYRQVPRRFVPLILLGLLFSVVAIPLIVIFPLGIFLAVRWSVCTYAMIIERDGPIHCLRRSWALTKGAWWHTFGTLLVIFLLYVIIAGIVQGIFTGIGGLVAIVGSTTVGDFFTTLGSAISTIFVTPFATTTGVVLYYELRARHEGFDLESRAAQLWQTP